MKQKRRSADSRDSRKTRASSVAAARIRRWARLAALRRYRALSGVHVPDPVRFYPVRAIDVNGTLEAARKTSLFPAETGTSKRRFRAKLAIRYRKIAKLVLNAFKTKVAAGAGGRVELERAVSASLRAC